MFLMNKLRGDCWESMSYDPDLGNPKLYYYYTDVVHECDAPQDCYYRQKLLRREQTFYQPGGYFYLTEFKAPSVIKGPGPADPHGSGFLQVAAPTNPTTPVPEVTLGAVMGGIHYVKVNYSAYLAKWVVAYNCADSTGRYDICIQQSANANLTDISMNPLDSDTFGVKLFNDPLYAQRYTYKPAVQHSKGRLGLALDRRVWRRDALPADQWQP